MLSHIYAVLCLLIWGVPIACCFVMLFSPRVRGVLFENSRANELLALSILLFVLIPMILTPNIPAYLVYWLMGISLAVYIAGGWKGRPKLRNFAMRFIFLGTLFLLLLSGAAASGDTFYGGWRHSGQTHWFFTEWEKVAEQDSADYPAGKLDADHPLMRQHPELAKDWKNVYGMHPYWHTPFTGLNQRIAVEPYDFPGGKPADHSAELERYFRPYWQPESKELFPGSRVILLLSGWLLITVPAGLILLRRQERRIHDGS